MNHVAIEAERTFSAKDIEEDDQPGWVKKN